MTNKSEFKLKQTVIYQSKFSRLASNFSKGCICSTCNSQRLSWWTKWGWLSFLQHRVNENNMFGCLALMSFLASYQTVYRDDFLVCLHLKSFMLFSYFKNICSCWLERICKEWEISNQPVNKSKMFGCLAMMSFFLDSYQTVLSQNFKKKDP